MFIDEITIEVVGGDGGAGALSFRREKFIPLGGPDGGPGGRGGSVIFRASRSLSTLVDFKFNRRFRAAKGEHGRGYGRDGKGADDLVLVVPAGTEVYDEETGERLADLAVDGQTFVAARGGMGGRGNTSFKSPERNAPRYCEHGEKGERRLLRLSLKLLADLGLVGLPNAGKSTLLSRVSNARPKIADYPFTTLAPALGMVRLSPGREFVLADLPGLIEGAADGKGLGHRFLKHIERTAGIVFLVDASPFADVDPVEALRMLRKELKKFDPGLLERPFVVVANKLDLNPEKKTLARLARSAGKGKLARISGATGEGIPELLETLFELRDAGRELAGEPEATLAPGERIRVPRPDEDTREGAIVAREQGVLHVTGASFLRRARMVNFDTPDAVFFFNQLCRQFDVGRKLKKAGARIGDTVDIDGMQFEYKDDMF